MRDFNNVSRVVVKVGSSTLTYENGRMNFSCIDHLARSISSLSNAGTQVVLVSSGAISVGTGKLNLQQRPTRMRDKQATAAVGQCELMHIYSKFFAEYGYPVAQILLTRDDVKGETRKRNIENTFEALLEKHIIPVVNENDTVSVDEIEAGESGSFNENDTLSALVTVMVKAQLLIILSDIDGFYDCNPRDNPNAQRFDVIRDITPDLWACAGGTGSSRGTGGMATKLNAAEIVTRAGSSMVLASGENPAVILDILKGLPAGTLFVPSPASTG